MKFKKFKKLSYRQKVPNSEAQYEYIRKVGQFEETLAPFKSLKYYMRTNNLHTVNKKLHDYIATQLSSFDVPFYNKLTYKQKTNAKAYYECLVEALTGVGEVFKISGVISDGTDPISGAVVVCDEEIVTTGADGEYKFEGLLPGRYYVKVSAEHYDNKQSQVTISSVDVERDITLDLIEFTVSGVISDDQETPEPVTGAVVKLDDLSFTTESDGEYEFTFVSKGEHNLTITAEGFDDEETTVTVSNADVTKNITLTTSSEE